MNMLLAVLMMAAQGSVAPAPVTQETAHLVVTTTAGDGVVAPGGKLTLVVEVAPKAHMHVYAPEQSAYIPVSLQVTPPSGLTARKPVFPKGETFFFAPTSETQIVFSKPFRIEVPVAVGRSVKPGPLALSGTLQYQACDDKVCYVPKKVPVHWTVTVR